MKINYNNTALGAIDYPDKFNFGFPKEMISAGETLSKEACKKLGHDILKGSANLKKLCKNIQLVKRTFWEAYAKGRHKLADIIDKVEIEEGGILITEGFEFTHTYYYYVRTYVLDGEWGYDLLFIDFSKHSKNDLPNLDVMITMSGDICKTAIWNQYIDDGKDKYYWATMIISFVIFKKYCDIETKVIENTRRTVINGHKYVNETGKKINVLDCTWFTDLVASGAFGVTGHLRWQWCGPGRTEKRLVYVHEYEKKGLCPKSKSSFSTKR